MLGYEEDLPLPARGFCLRDGGANLVEGEGTRSRGHENALAHQRDDFLDQLTLCGLVQSVKPVSNPEDFQDAAACQNEAWVGSYTNRLASEGTIDQHSALLAQRLVHLRSCFSDHRIDGVLDALWANDPADLLVNRPLGGHNDGIGPQAFQFSHRFAPVDAIHRANAIVFVQPADL